MKAFLFKLIIFCLFMFTLSNMYANNHSPIFPDSLFVSSIYNNYEELSSLIHTKGYRIMDTAQGDLNNDEVNDLLVILKDKAEDENKNADEVNERDRILLIVITDHANKLVVKRANYHTVYCRTCGGMMGDTYTHLVIKKGYFSVDHYGGSAWRWTRTITYKFHPKKNEWYLHKNESTSFHAAAYKKVKRTIYTTKDFGWIKFEDFNINPE